jgi:hypothetical protein
VRSLVLIGVLCVCVGMVLPTSATSLFSVSNSRNVIWIKGSNETMYSLFRGDLKHNQSALVSSGAPNAISASLLGRTITAKDTAWMSLTISVHPADNRTLKYNSTNPELYIRCSAVSGTGTVTILCNLTGYNGTTFFRNITISGVSSSIPILTQEYDTCTAFVKYRVTTFTGFTSMTFYINQTRHGVVWHLQDIPTEGYQNGSYFINCGTIQVGVGATTKGNFTINNCSVLFGQSEFWKGLTFGNQIIYVRAYGKLKINNSYIVFNINGALNPIYTSLSVYPVYILNSYLYNAKKNLGNQYCSFSTTVPTYVNHSIIRRLQFTIGYLSMDDVTFIGDGSPYALYSINTKYCNNVVFTNYTYPIECNAYPFLIQSSTIDNCQYMFYSNNMFYNASFRDVTTNTRTIYPSSTWSSSNVYVNRTETLNVRLMNGSTSVNGGYVEYVNSTGVSLWNKTTNSNGFIPSTVVEVERWPGVNTPLWRTPGLLKITYGNYHSTMVINLSNYGVGGCNLTIPVFNNWSSVLSGGSLCNVTVSEVNPADGNNTYNFLTSNVTLIHSVGWANDSGTYTVNYLAYLMNISFIVNSTFSSVDFDVYMNYEFGVLGSPWKLIASESGYPGNFSYYRTIFPVKNTTVKWRIIVYDPVTGGEAYNRTFSFTTKHNSSIFNLSTIPGEYVLLGGCFIPLMIPFFKKRKEVQ